MRYLLDYMYNKNKSLCCPYIHTINTKLSLWVPLMCIYACLSHVCYAFFELAMLST